MTQTLSSLLKDGESEVKMITDYVSEDQAVPSVSWGCPFDPQRIGAL